MEPMIPTFSAKHINITSVLTVAKALRHFTHNMESAKPRVAFEWAGVCKQFVEFHLDGGDSRPHNNTAVP